MKISRHLLSKPVTKPVEYLIVFNCFQGLGHTENASIGHTRGVPPKPQQHVKDWDVMSAQDWDHSGGGLHDDAYRDHPNSRTPQPYRKYTPIDKVSIKGKAPF